MRSVRDISVTTAIPIIVRTALNVPIDSGKVTNLYRLQRSLPTLAYLRERGARIILISHIGEQGTETLAPVAEALSHLMPHVSFCPDTLGERARKAVRDLLPGHTLILENLRRHVGEKNNDISFARDVASLGDVFVQDSFDTCHRPHASIIGIPNYLPSYAGLQLEEEVRELSHALSPRHPSLAIIGGAKFSTKEPVLTRLLEQYDHVFAGGALANDFLKAEGHPVGASLTSLASKESMTGLLQNPHLLLPVDSMVSGVAHRTIDGRPFTRNAGLDDVRDDETILDHGAGTIALLTDQVQRASTILWNGPLGKYEDGFVDATDALAEAIAASGARSIVGGGDTIASIEKLGLLARFSFVSTGGGAMLDFLATGTLPGIIALG